MPLTRYYHGNGPEVMAKMKAQYGPKKGESVFYATANKKANRGKSPKRLNPRKRKPGNEPANRHYF